LQLSKRRPTKIDEVNAVNPPDHLRRLNELADDGFCLRGVRLGILGAHGRIIARKRQHA
jgi:hypothetical protein